MIELDMLPQTLQYRSNVILSPKCLGCNQNSLDFYFSEYKIFRIGEHPIW